MGKFLRTSVLFAVLFTQPIVANGTILTGADLLSLASFPTTTPTSVGSSIRFGPGSGFDKLMELEVFPANAFPNGDTFSVLFNMTRLPCSGACIGAGDWDPHFMLGDGSTLIGAAVIDNNAGARSSVLDDGVSQASNRRELTNLFSGATFPSDGESVDVGLDFTLSGAATSIMVSMSGLSGTYNTTTTLDLTKPLNLVLLRDNDGGEQYQVNSLTLPSGVPEPTTLALLGLGLAGIAARNRREACRVAP